MTPIVRRRPAQRKPETGWRRGTSPTVYGLVGIALILLATYYAFNHSLPFLGGGYELTAEFSNATQLDTGSPVRIAGVNVGTVTAIAPGPGRTAKVTMQIDDIGQPIHRDATLEIRPRLFLEGSFYIDVHPGSPSAPTIPSGSTIPEHQTSVAVQLDQVLSTLDAANRDSVKSIVAQSAVALEGGGAQGLRQTTSLLAPVLNQTAQLTRALQGTQPHDLSHLIASAASVTGTLASTDGRLADLLTSTNVVAGALAGRDTQLSQSLAELDGLLREAPAPLAALDQALPPLRSFSLALQPALQTAPPVLAHTAGLFDQLAGLARPSELPRLVTLLAPTLGQFPTLDSRLRFLFTFVTPVTDCVARRVVPVLDAMVPDGSLSSGRPAWQDLAHFGVGLTSALQNIDGNGDYLRGLGVVGDQSVSLGTLPGTGQLFASTAVSGARPVWLGQGVSPPWRPDQSCRAQAPVSLAATTAAADTRPAPSAAPNQPLSPLMARGRATLRRLLLAAFAAPGGTR